MTNHQPKGRPDWDVMVVDGEPVEVINAAGVAQLIRNSPLGVAVATAKMRAALPPHIFAAVEQELS